jgi:pyruvate, water dikinase
MNKPTEESHHQLLVALQERAKELNCIYEVEKLLTKRDLDLSDILDGVVRAIPPGFQYPDVCRVELAYKDERFHSELFDLSEVVLKTELSVQDEPVGWISVYYSEPKPEADFGPFLIEEQRLIDTIADRLGHFIFYRTLRDLNRNLRQAEATESQGSSNAWRAPIHLLRESDKGVYLCIARKMINHLIRLGVSEARDALAGEGTGPLSESACNGESNVPARRQKPNTEQLLTDFPFELAAKHISSDEILSRVQHWMVEDKAGNLMKILNSQRSSLPEIAAAIHRFYHLVADGEGLPDSTRKSLRITLTQRLLTEQLNFVRTAKEFIGVADFAQLIDRIIMPPESHGRLGGKAAGLLLAQKILEQTQSDEQSIGDVRIPKTWYIASDGLLDFVVHNDLQDVIEQKYKEIDQVRNEYPSIIGLFKSSAFSPRVISGLSVALDDFDDCPLIVRSSSLLEDRLGTAFSGKYKSLFLANQGTKDERLGALMDAVAEVYASTFGPDPIEYRRDHDLLEFNEEMGILIQAVVGKNCGHYFFPAFAGVALSKNEFRWSPRISRDDGLLRMVPGLGTRAVDRVADDYPVLAVPGKPRLRANVAIDEIVRYSPRQIDLINLHTRTLETRDLKEILDEHYAEYDGLESIFSILRDGILQKPARMLVDPQKDQLVATFEYLFTGTPFLNQVRNMLNLLQEHLATPVDIEFAHDGQHFYLLQCRPQSQGGESAPSPIPKDVAESNVVFTANRFVSNGWVPDITHVVYVDPEAYSALDNKQDLLAVGRVVSKLNRILPKRQFILIGPGRWGSRGDLKLGVSVTYADISNTAMLIEVARQKGRYLPDLSFGTHFFQDLVEARIRYLPLYPDDDGTQFNEYFLTHSHNLLTEIVPDADKYSDVVRVIDVPSWADGKILRVLQNAELDEAIAIFVQPDESRREVTETETTTKRKPIQYWQWRFKMAEQISRELDPERFGVAAIYVFGSTKNATAGPASDIDLLIHFRGNEGQRCDLLNWLEGWGLCLAEINYLRTGYRTGPLLDIHLITDEDIASQSSYAVKIGAVTDAARELPLGPGSPAIGR